MQLVKGSRVVIAGGGPAGSFSALHLLKLSAEQQLDLEVVIFEPRDFHHPGPGGCNKCAGILSSTLVRNLSSFGLQIPAPVIQSELHTYVLHFHGFQLPLNQPDPEKKIVSVYRGGGPRLGEQPFPASFDGWLLDQAVAMGASLKRNRVQSISLGSRPEINADGESWTADLVIVATGVNSRTPHVPGWAYKAPRSKVMAQNEVLLNPGYLDSSVHILFEPPSSLVFGGIIPKGRYANISLLGDHLTSGDISTFLGQDDLQGLFSGDPLLLCGCTPRVSVSPAEGYYADRLVAVGDAAVTRLYKDGIGSAYLTAQAAVRSAVQNGISQEDFKAGYQPICQRIAHDNLYGRLLFKLWSYSRRRVGFVNLWKQTIMAESELPAPKRVHTRALWSMFTGDESYRKIFFRSLFSLAAYGSMLRGAWSAWRRT
ncbi:MAG TPA: hypothetical protein VJ436_08865 [Anaerolineales bacterium]|nr:hypothetical protein [Anaerolineales bacterium]